MPELSQQLRLCGGDDRAVAVLVAHKMTIHIERRLDTRMPKPSRQTFEVDVLLNPAGGGSMPQGMKVVSRPHDGLALPVPLVGGLPKTSGDLERPILTIEHVGVLADPTLAVWEQQSEPRLRRAELPLATDTDQDRPDRDSPVARLRFRRADIAPLIRSLADRDLGSAKIHIDSAERAELGRVRSC